MTVKEALRLPLDRRLQLFGTQTITDIKIDSQKLSGYKGYSFFWEKTLVESPERSDGGRIDLSTHAFFITPHLIIDFALISIDDYRILSKLFLLKNEFAVTFYDTIFDKVITEPMYFAPEKQPAYKTMRRTLNGEKWTELLGVKDYQLELIGTNNTDKKFNIEYRVNAPANAIWNGEAMVTERDIYKNASVAIGRQALVTKNTGEETKVPVSSLTFGDKYKFQYWAENADGSGFRYLDGDEYILNQDLYLYAIWKASAK